MFHVDPHAVAMNEVNTTAGAMNQLAQGMQSQLGRFVV